LTGIHGPSGCVGFGADEHAARSAALQSTTINFTSISDLGVLSAVAGCSDGRPII